MRHRIPNLVSLALSTMLAATAAGAQNHASPGGAAYAGDGSCASREAPCSLAAAIEDATDGAGSGVVYLLPEGRESVAYAEHLVGAGSIDAPVTFAAGPFPRRAGGEPSIVTLTGDMVVDDTTVTLAEGLELRMRGSSLSLRGRPGILGLGFLVARSGTIIQLGNPAEPRPHTPKVATIENLRVDAPYLSVLIRDQGIDTESDLFITNRLEVLAGVLDMGEENLHMVGPIAAPNGILIAEGARIEGRATLSLSPDPAALGGPPNQLELAYPVEGDGALLMNFDKDTDAGVRVELPSLGGGRGNLHRAGALYFTRASGIFGDLVVQDAARVEFQAPVVIDGDLVVSGPGGEVFPADGTCNGNESGVYFSAPVDIRGDLALTNTDAPGTTDCVEGAEFLADDLLGGSQVRSSVAGRLSTAASSGLRLASSGVAHNLAVAGDVILFDSPTLAFDAPSTDGESCAGNELALVGDLDPQELESDATTTLPSLRIQKASTGQAAEVVGFGDTIRIDSLLAEARGTLVETVALDPASVAATSGLACASCPALPRDDCRRPVVPGSAVLSLNAKGTLKFKWFRGEETKIEAFGDPTTETDYSFCLYDRIEEIPRLALGASLPGGTSWSAQSTGFRYARSDGAPDGVTKAKLKAGPDGVARATLVAKGVNPPPLPLSQQPNVVAQLVNDAGECWQATFSNFAKRNDRKKFKDRGD